NTFFTHCRRKVTHAFFIFLFFCHVLSFINWSTWHKTSFLSFSWLRFLFFRNKDWSKSMSLLFVVIFFRITIFRSVIACSSWSRLICASSFFSSSLCSSFFFSFDSALIFFFLLSFSLRFNRNDFRLRIFSRGRL